MLLNAFSLILYVFSHLLLASALGLLAMKLRFPAVPKMSLFFVGAATTPFVYGCLTLLVLLIPAKLPSAVYVLLPMVLSAVVLVFNRKALSKIPTYISKISTGSKLVLCGSFALFPALTASQAFVVFLRLHWSFAYLMILGAGCSFLFVCLAALCSGANWKSAERLKRIPAFLLAILLIFVAVCLTLMIGVWQDLKTNALLVAGGFILFTGLAFLTARILPLLGLEKPAAKCIAADYGILAIGLVLLRAFLQLTSSLPTNTNETIAISAAGCVLIVAMIGLALFLSRRMTTKQDSGADRNIAFSSFVRAFCSKAILLFCAVTILSAAAEIAIRATTPVTGADAMEYMTSSYEIANDRTLSSINIYNGSEDGSQIGIVHHPAWTAYLAQALMHSPGTPQAYPLDLAARSTYALTYVYLFLAVFALARAFLPNLFALLAVALSTYTPFLGYLISNNSREGFRITPILLLILVLYGYASAVSEKRRVHWPELVGVFFVAAFTMMGHVLNGIPALGIGLAILIFCLITRNFHWNTVWMAVAAGLGGVFGSLQIILGYLERGQLLSDFISLDSILADTPYLANFTAHQLGRLGDTMTYLDRLNVIVRYDHGLLTVVGIAIGIWFIVRLIRTPKQGRSGEITGLLGLVGLFFALLFTDFFSWSGYTLTEWSIMNVRYISHLYPVYAVIVAGGLYYLERLQTKGIVRTLAISGLICGYAALQFVNVGYTYPLENMAKNTSDVPTNYTAAYQEHEKQDGRLLIDNYYCNYYFRCEAMTIFSDAAIEIRRAQTVPELSAALEKNNIDAVLISDAFVSVYWHDTILLELLESDAYQATDYGFFTIYQSVESSS